MNGYVKRWSVENISNQISSAVAECVDPYHDGYVTWGIKQDLYRIKWLIDDALKRCPNYAPEEEWLKKHEREQIIEILKK